MHTRAIFLIVLILCIVTTGSSQQKFAGQIRGRVTDQTGNVIPGVTVELRLQKQTPRTTWTNDSGEYSFTGLPDGKYRLSFSLVNFATIQREFTVESESVRADAVLRVAFNSTVSVTTKATFFNL